MTSRPQVTKALTRIKMMGLKPFTAVHAFLFKPSTGRLANRTSVFTDANSWNGGFYELALEYPANDPNGLAAGLEHLWNVSAIEGCYLDHTREPENQSRLRFQQALIDHGHLYGIATLPNGKRVACGTSCLRNYEGLDWLVFYCPMGALAQVYPVAGFPFDRAHSESWRTEIDGWLSNIGIKLFEDAPFRLGLIGFEVSDETSSEEVKKTGIPQQRYDGFLVPKLGHVTWYPPNEV
jgi:hypothetical protein